MEETIIEGLFSLLLIIGMISTGMLFTDYYTKRQEQREQEKNELRNNMEYLVKCAESNSQKIEVVRNICDEIRTKGK